MPHQKNLQLNFAQHHAVSVQLNLSTTATLGTDKSGHCREVAVVQRLKQEWMYMYGLSAKKKNGRCREVAVSGGTTVCML